MRNARGGQRVQKTHANAHSAWSYKSTISKRGQQIPHFPKERLSSLCFPACFLSWRLGERAARWSVSVYAAELSPFTPFVVVLEREAVLNPSRSTSSKRFPYASTWTPRPVKVKLYERDKGASRSSGSPHTLRRRYTAFWWVSLSDEADRRLTKAVQTQVSAPHSPVLYGNRAGTPEHHDNQTEWSICHSLMDFCAVATYIILMIFSNTLQY